MHPILTPGAVKISDFRPLPNKNVQFWDHFFPALFPKDSESLKILDIQLRKWGQNRPQNLVHEKGQTYKYTTDIATLWSNRPSGPIRWKSWICTLLLERFKSPSPSPIIVFEDYFKRHQEKENLIGLKNIRWGKVHSIAVTKPNWTQTSYSPTGQPRIKKKHIF